MPKSNFKIDEILLVLIVVIIAMLAGIYDKIKPTEMEAEKITEMILDGHSISFANNGIIDEGKLKEIQNIKKQHPNEEIIVKAQDDDFNRKILENKSVNILLSPELHNRKEPLKQRDSGLNEILCRIAKNNNIKIGIDIDEIKKLDKKRKSKVLARIIQNINLCKKTGAEFILFPKNKYKKQDIMGFLQSLKSSTIQAKKAVQ